ncbi:unnamed protein product [Discosporangium mesarthrocarpum]
MFLGMVLKWKKVLNINLNPVVWKVLLGRRVNFSDLELLDETYYRSLKLVLDTPGANQLGLSFGDLDLRFISKGGNRVRGDIDPDADVNDKNKALYADLAVESLTYGRWKKQAKALATGVNRLVPLGLLRMFSENELGLLLAGPGDIDPADWRRHTIFTGYDISEELKGWFWSVVESLSLEERSLLLKFSTGCLRLPVGGFAALQKKFTVVVIEYDPQRPLPMAATCFFMLKMPNYPNHETLERSLLVAIRHGASGFEFS